MPWLWPEPPEHELERLDYQRSLDALGAPPENAGTHAPRVTATLADAVDAGLEPVPPEASIAPAAPTAAGAMLDSPSAPTLARPAGVAGAEPPPYLEISDTSTGVPPRVPHEQGKNAQPDTELPGSVLGRIRDLRSLRAAVEAASHIPIRNGNGELAACGDHAHWEDRYLANDEVDSRLVIEVCHRRDRCPHCSIDYGEDLGAELFDMLQAAAAGARDRRNSDPLAFRFDVTLPHPVELLVTRWFNEGDMERVRWALVRLSSHAEAAAWQLFKRDGLRRDELGYAVAIHGFHSRYPLAECLHPHAHLTLPNCTSDGLVLYHKARRSGEALKRARAKLRDRVMRDFGPLCDLSGYRSAVLKYGWVSSRAGLRKRARYVARSPWHDVAKLAPGRIYSESGMERLARFDERMVRWQPIKTLRYRGWLHGRRRRAAGLVRVDAPESDRPKWTPRLGGYRNVAAWRPDGLYVRYWDFGVVEVMERVAYSQVIRGPRAPPPRWEWRGEDEAPGDIGSAHRPPGGALAA